MRFLFLLILIFPLHIYAAVSISEIMYDLPSPGVDDGREWVEIVNMEADPVDLAGWKFFEGNSNHGLTSVSGETVLRPGDFALIVSDVEKFKTDNPYFSGLIFDSSFSLNNTGETLTLRNSELTDADSVTYSEEWGGKEGMSLQKVNSVWVSSTPTPGITNVGSQNNSSPSVPNSIGLQPQTETPSFTLSASITSGTQTNAGTEMLFEGKAKKDTDVLVGGQYVWTFGDGVAGEGKIISHTFATSGIYTVMLNVFYEGENASDSLSVTVLNEPKEEPVSVAQAPVVSATVKNKKSEHTQDTIAKNTVFYPKKEPYVSEEKSASIPSESDMEVDAAIAATAASQNPIFPWILALVGVIGVPTAFIFFIKPKKSEADEIEIIE